MLFSENHQGKQFLTRNFLPWTPKNSSIRHGGPDKCHDRSAGIPFVQVHSDIHLPKPGASDSPMSKVYPKATQVTSGFDLGLVFSPTCTSLMPKNKAACGECVNASHNYNYTCADSIPWGISFISRPEPMCFLRMSCHVMAFLLPCLLCMLCS